MKCHGIPVVIAVSVFLLAGCDRPVEPPKVGYEDQPKQDLATSKGATHATRAKQADFLNRIRAADPQSRTIERALLNEHNELGLILDRSVQMDDIPKLMRSMLAEMAKEFPNQDLTVVAYAPSDPPRKIGTARLNSSTRDMTYTPEK